MSLTFQPIRVATGFDEEGMLVLDEDQRLVAVLTHLSDQYDGLSGQWYKEAKFGALEGPSQPTYLDLGTVREAIAQHLTRRH